MSVPISWMTAVFVCVSVTFPAWAYGGAETWAIHGLAGLVLISFICAALSLIHDFRTMDMESGCHHPAIRSRDWLWGVPLLGVVAFIAVQVLNPSHSYSPFDQGLTALPHIAWLPSTVSSPSTINALLLLLSYSVIYWITSRVIDGRGLYRLIGVVIAGAVGMALLALLQGSEHERWELVGRFLNENSFSSYINLVFPVALGSARVLQQRAKRQKRRSNPGILLYFCAGILAASVLLSGSRAGAIVTILILLIWMLLEWRDVRRTRRRRHSDWFHIVLPVLPVAGLLVLFGVEIISSEVAGLKGRIGLHIAARISAACGALRMFMDNPVFGTGAGTFHAAFPYYQDASLGGFYRHAHNDWAQWLAELGVVGCGFGLFAVVTAFRRRPVRHKSAQLSPFIVRGMWLGLAGVALHAVIDLPFRIPAIAVSAAVWAGALARRPSEFAVNPPEALKKNAFFRNICSNQKG